MACKPEEVVSFAERQMQPLSDRGDHLLRRLRAAFLLKARVIVGRHVTQRGDFLAPQPGGATTLPAGQPDILGL